MTEAEFIQQLKDKTRASYSKLLDDFEQKVFGTCISFVPNKEDAEDIAQDVFVEIFNSIHKFNAHSKLSTWVYRITTNKCLEFIRKRNAKKRFSFLQSLSSNEYTLDKASYFTNINHPGLVLEQKELSETLFMAINKLPEAQRLVFTLNKIDNKSYKEISEITNKSIGSIESLLFRAKKNLRKILHHFYKNEI